MGMFWSESENWMPPAYRCCAGRARRALPSSRGPAKTYPSITFVTHHFLSTHHVAAPPRLLGLFMRRRPSTIRPLLARHQKPNLVTSTFALPIAPAAARTAALNSGIHRFEGWIKTAGRLHLRGPVDDDGKRHVTAGTDAMILRPCPQHLAQQLALGVVGANISPSCRADPPCQATPAPTERCPTRLRKTPAAATPRDGLPRCRPGRSSDMPQYICRDHRGWT